MFLSEQNNIIDVAISNKSQKITKIENCVFSGKNCFHMFLRIHQNHSSSDAVLKLFALSEIDIFS